MRYLRVTRSALLGDLELEAIVEGAARLLEQFGVEITHPELLARAQQKGFLAEQGRVRISRRQVNKLLEETGAVKKPSRPAEADHTAPVCMQLGPSSYPQNIHDLVTDQIVPLTCAKLVDATKLVDTLADRGVSGALPGCPTDVPPPLQVLAQYRIGVENLQGWRGPVDAKALESLPYVMAMAEVMGNPIRGLPVYVFSPLKIAGESLTAVLQYEEQLDSVYVGSMPAAGSTAPIHPVEAFALAAAEVIGSAIILRECLKPQVQWGISVHPFDLRGMAMSFGSPESTLFDMASSEVNAFLHGQPWWPAVGNALTLAKLPNQQAIAEKASLMTIGACLGARYFNGAGTLSLDEVFSPVQLLLDVEIKDHVERLANGLDVSYDLDSFIDDVKTGVNRGFLGLERTLDSYTQFSWHPQLFERRFLAPWQLAGCPDLTDKAKQQAHELIAQHSYSPPQDIKDALDAIYRKAEKDLLNQ